MRIVHLIESLDDSYGGPAKSVPYLAHYSSFSGSNTIMLSCKATENDHNEVISVKNLHWETFQTYGPRKLRYSPDLRRRLIELAQESSKPQVFHVHNQWNYVPFIADKISRKYGIPLIVSVRGSLFPWSLEQGKLRKKAAWHLFQKSLLQNAAAIHTTSSAERSALEQLGFSENVFQISNGIELNTSEVVPPNLSEAKALLGLPKSKRYVLFLSRLHKKKGIELLLDAWAKLKTEGWELLIAGNSDDKNYLKHLHKCVDALDIEHCVKFVGFANADKKALLMAASEVFVLPSYTENFGISIAEAMYAGLPVVTTFNTPWAEINAAGAGWCVDLQPSLIKQALGEAIAKSPSALANMGRKAQAVSEKYDWRPLALEMNKVYADIIQR